MLVRGVNHTQPQDAPPTSGGKVRVVAQSGEERLALIEKTLEVTARSSSWTAPPKSKSEVAD